MRVQNRYCEAKRQPACRTDGVTQIPAAHSLLVQSFFVAGWPLKRRGESFRWQLTASVVSPVDAMHRCQQSLPGALQRASTLPE
jgi:hypothetical protein